MCIIIAKDKKHRLPSDDELKQCFTNNKDGAGFMYTLNHNVIIDKGYMNYDEFLKRFKYLCKRFNNFNNKSLVIHCRIGTAGTNTAQNTHPYPLTNNIDDLHKTYFRTKVGIAHNGIISAYNPLSSNNTKDINDTQNFISSYLYDLYKNYKQFYKSKAMIEGIEHLTNSKFAILNNNDELITIGDFTTNDNLLFSNTSYKKYEYKLTHYYNYKDWNFDDYYDYDYWNTSKTSAKTTSSNLNNTYSDTSYINIPQSYNIFFDNDVWQGSDYYLNDDGDLLRYNSDSKKYDYITSDFTLYDSNWDLIEVEKLLGI